MMTSGSWLLQCPNPTCLVPLAESLSQQRKIWSSKTSSIYVQVKEAPGGLEPSQSEGTKGQEDTARVCTLVSLEYLEPS